MKKQSLKGKIKGRVLNKYDELNQLFSLTFDLDVNKVIFTINVLPVLKEIPDQIIPEWFNALEEKEIEINIIDRWGKYYCHENDFWRAMINAK